MNDGHNYDLRFLNLNDYDNAKAYQEMVENVEFMANTQIPLIEDPGTAGDLLKSGAVYGYRRATKMGMEPIIVLNIRHALDQGILEPDITAGVMFMMTYV